MLSSNLDEARGYCLDIAGGKGANAPLDKGLQAHTCYHYTGGILEDQGFDAALISEGEFRIPVLFAPLPITKDIIHTFTSAGMKSCRIVKLYRLTTREKVEVLRTISQKQNTSLIL